MFRMSPEVANILMNRTTRPELFDWLLDTGPVVWLSQQILLCGINGVMGKN
jgi:hypothetical protein